MQLRDEHEYTEDTYLYLTSAASFCYTLLFAGPLHPLTTLDLVFIAF